MAILTLDKLNFTWEDLLKKMQTRKTSGKAISPDLLLAAQTAYNEGIKLLNLQVSYELYKKVDIDDKKETLIISEMESSKTHTLLLGPKVGYLHPAQIIAIAVATAGGKITDAITAYSQKGDYLMMYYMDAFGVMALSSLSAFYRSYLEKYATEKSYGIGPFMQPGSVKGWDVACQKNLYFLAHGETINLKVNEAALLVPHISNSSLIGIGSEYKTGKVGSMCDECPRRADCLWHRENVV